ncbi:MAG: hypothetical protein CMI26_00350 [Opitutae bacterium]|nr:hypothetical protein [Opitutae bacterium]
MLSPTAPVFGNLASATSRALAGLQRSLLNEPTAQALAEGDGGKHTFATRLRSLNQKKQTELQNVQSAMTYLQLQDSGLQVGGQIMDRMGAIAVKARDPNLSRSERVLLIEDFRDMQESLNGLQSTDFQGHFLFQESIDFSSGLNEKNTTPEFPATYEGYNDNIYSSDQRHLTGQKIKRWTSIKDVRYDRGKVTLQVNSGTGEERYYLKQGNSNVIFDTGWWETSGNAYNGDKDQFVVEYSPGENTTYQFSSLDSDSDGIDDNASFHQNDRGSYVENRWGESVITNQAVSGQTSLTVVVESRSLFQASAIYGAALSKDVLDVPTGDGLVKISPSLFSTLYDVSVDTFENAIAAADKIIHEIDVLASSRGQLGVRMNELQHSADRLSLALSAEAKHLNRMEGDIAENVISNAKSRILLDSNAALLVHARGMNRELMNSLL